jgi:hypothetical protein
LTLRLGEQQSGFKRTDMLGGIESLNHSAIESLKTVEVVVRMSVVAAALFGSY